MLLPAWLWIVVTIVALVISVIALLNGLSTRGRMEVFTKKTETLERDMVQYRDSLDRALEQLQKLESEYQNSKDSEDLSHRISILEQEVTDLEGRKQGLEAEIESSAGLLDERREEFKKLAELGDQIDREREKRDEHES